MYNLYRKSILLVISLLGLCITGVMAQNAFTASGGTATGAGGTVSYSVGQVFYKTLSGGGFTVLQGVEQGTIIPIATATPSFQYACSGNGIASIVPVSTVSGSTFSWSRDNTVTVTGIAASGSGNISGVLTNTTAAPVTVTFTITPLANGRLGAPINATVTVIPSPSCTGKTIPGRIEAESFDSKFGSQFAVPTSDIGGGMKVVGFITGDLMDYNVLVTQAGIYQVNFRAATTHNNSQFKLISGSTVLGTINIPSTGGWDNWATFPLTNIPLSAGLQTLRIQSTGSENADLNWMDFVLTAGTSPTANAGPNQVIVLPTSQTTLSGSGAANNGGTITYAWTELSGPNQPPAIVITTPTAASTTVTGLIQGTYMFRLTVTRSGDNLSATSDVTITLSPPNTSTPFTGTRKPIPGKLEAEEYDNGGQNTAYLDGTAANLGGAFRTTEAVDVRTCPDVGGGFCVGWTTDGEWLKFSVNVTTTGSYNFTARIASPNTGKSILFQVDGTPAGTLTVLNTGGFNNWQTAALNNIPLTAGDHTFRFLFNTGDGANPDLGFDINWFNFDLASASTPTANAGPNQGIVLPTSQATLSGSGAANNGGTITYVWTELSGPNQPPTVVIQTPTAASTIVSGLIQGVYMFRLTVTRSGDNQTATSDVTVTVSPANTSTPFTGTRKPIPGKLEAEEYDNGGQNTAYLDGTAANLGGAFRLSEAVDVRSCPDIGGGFCVGWTTDGEWLKFSVNVTTTGTYNFTARIASPNTGKSIQFQVDGAAVGTLSVLNTGGYNNWQTAALNNLQLTAGDHTFRFLFNTGDAANPDLGFDVNWFNFELVSGSTPTANAGSNQVIVLPTNQTTLSGSGAANNGGTITYAWTEISGPNQPPAVVIATPNAASTNVSGLIQGIYTFRLTVTRSGDNQTATSDVTVTVNAASNGKTIPGRIEAESWDAKFGPQYAIPTTDVGGGLKVVGINNGSWQDYNVTVTQAGNYTVNFRVATTQVHAQFQIKVNGNLVATINIPGTGDWNNWMSFPVSGIALAAGPQVIRIQSTNNENCDFNWTEWSLTAPPVTAPVTTVNSVIVTEAAQKGITAKALSLSVFPNPASSWFNLRVDSKSMEQVRIKVMDIAGRQVQQLEGMPGQTIRFGDKMVNGTYLVEVIQGSERVVTKVVKQ